MYNYINDNYKIDFRITGCLKELMEEAEQKDKEGDLGYYLNLADTIDTFAKNYYAAGEITEEQWNIISMRYAQ